MRAPSLLALVLLPGVAACELTTHALDYRVDDTASPLCEACPAAAEELRRPPCPTGDTAPHQAASFTFAARRASFGHPPDVIGPHAAAFDLGFDLDCSDRPHRGLPALCVPASPQGWSPLPRGIDNAFLQRALVPVYQGAPPDRPFDLDMALTTAFEHGSYGLLVTVDGWNGAPDDPEVEIMIHTSPGLAAGAGAPPAWDGADVWARYPDITSDGMRPFHLARLPGYVTGGTLVADARARGAALYHFGLRTRGFDVVLADLVFAGAIAPAGLTKLTMAGTIDLASARDAAIAFTGALACEPNPRDFFAALPAELPGAADMPASPTAERTDRCDAISFAWSFDAEPAHVGAVLESAISFGGDPPPCP